MIVIYPDFEIYVDECSILNELSTIILNQESIGLESTKILATVSLIDNTISFNFTEIRTLENTMVSYTTAYEIDDCDLDFNWRFFFETIDQHWYNSEVMIKLYDIKTLTELKRYCDCLACIRL